MTLPPTDLVSSLTLINHHVSCCTMRACMPALHTEHLPCSLIVWPPHCSWMRTSSPPFFFSEYPEQGLCLTFMDSLEQREEISPGGLVLCSCLVPVASAPLATPGSHLKVCANLGCRLKAGQGDGSAMATFYGLKNGKTNLEQSIHLMSCFSSCTQNE